MLRKAQLVCEHVQVLCPYCGDSQPSPNDSTFWEKLDFDKNSGRFKCVSCDEEMLIVIERKALFQ